MEHNSKISGFTCPTNDRKKQNSETKKMRNLFAPSSTEDTFNKIRFWEDVDNDTCEDLIDNIKAVEDKLMELQKNYNIPFEHLPSIEIHINSCGGSVFAALAVVDYIKASKFKFTSVIEGFAASAATLISCVCEKRVITEHSMILIHQLSSGVIGKMSEMIDELNACHKLMNIIIKMYREHTNVDVNSIKRILTRDIFWNAEEALQLGIVDEILMPIKQVRRICRTTNFKISSAQLEQGMLNVKRTLEETDSNPLLSLMQLNKNAKDDASSSDDEVPPPKKQRTEKAPKKAPKKTK